MRTLVTIAALTIALVGSAVGRADAQGIGVCFKADQFTDVFVMTYNFNGPNQLVGTGRDTVIGAVVSSTIVLTGGTAMLGLHTHTPPTGGGHAFWFSANISIASLTGPGVCEAVNTGGGGCGGGTPITVSTVTCPPDAFETPTASDAAARKGSMGSAARAPGSW